VRRRIAEHVVSFMCSVYFCWSLSEQRHLRQQVILVYRYISPCEAPKASAAGVCRGRDLELEMEMGLRLGDLISLMDKVPLDFFSWCVGGRRLC